MRSSSLNRRGMLHLLGAAPPLLWLTGCGGSSDEGSASRAPTSTEADGLRITRDGDKLILESNGVPNHPTGAFPNKNCPFGIMAHARKFTVAANPVVAAKTTAIDGWLFGVAINGVVFDPTGPYLYDGTKRTDWHFEVMSAAARPSLGLDMNNAHSQPGGEYHYHGLPVGLLDMIAKDGSITLAGYAADGFPIYAPYGNLKSGYRLKNGKRAGDVPGGKYDGTFVQDYEWAQGVGDLDECNGHVGKTPEYPDGIYHYVLTSEFPFVPRAWRGTPDASFAHPSPGPDAVPPALRNYRGT